MKTENKNQIDLDKLTAVVKGTTAFFIAVEIPHTIRLSKDDDNYFFKELLRDDYDPKNGFWNGELDFIKNQLPSQEKDLAVAKEFINAGKISDFHRSHNFAVESFSWEAKN